MISLCFGLDSDLDNRLGESHSFKNHRVFTVTESITGFCISQTDCRDDITRQDLFQIYLFSIGLNAL